MIDDQYFMKKLPPKLQPTMTRICGQQVPQDRFRENEAQVANLIASSKRCETDFLTAYGLSLQERFVQVEGRLLDQPRLIGPNEKAKQLENGGWRDTTFILPAAIPNNFQWFVVNFTREYGRDIFRAPNQGQVDDLVKNLIVAGNRNGLKLPQPQVCYREQYQDPTDLRAAFEDYCKDMPNLGLILFLIPPNDELYNNIKFVSELKHGILTQCVAHDKSMKFGDRTYCENLMLKINSKLGGINAQLGKECKVGHLKVSTFNLTASIFGHFDCSGTFLIFMSPSFHSCAEKDHDHGPGRDSSVQARSFGQLDCLCCGLLRQQDGQLPLQVRGPAEAAAGDRRPADDHTRDARQLQGKEQVLPGLRAGLP